MNQPADLGRSRWLSSFEPFRVIGLSCFLALCVPIGALEVAEAQTPRIGALRAESSVQLEIARERVDLECEEHGERDLNCRVRLEWILHNGGAEIVQPRLRMSWDGEPQGVVVKADDAVLANEIPRLRPIALVVAPGEDVVLSIEATQPLRDYLGSGGHRDAVDAIDGLFARHPLLAMRWELRKLGLVWTRASALSFTRVGPTVFEFALPTDWQTRFDSDAPIRRTGTEAVYEPSDERVAQISFGLELSKGIHTDLVRHGGPHLALGGTFDQGFRGRIGYDMGLGEWMILSLSGDTDFAHQGVIAPLVEVASNSLGPLPSAALGVGAPIQVAPYVLGGIRVEVSLTFIVIGVVATLDYWPQESRAQLSILGRLSL